MAKKRTSRKITRRDAVTMLGAGAVLGTARTKSEAAAVTVQGPPCSKPAAVQPYDIVVNNKPRLALTAYACCEEGRTAVLAGTQTAGRKPTTSTHLRPLTDALQTATLDEYCFMIWGLTEEQAMTLSKTMPESFRMKPRILKK